MLNIFKTSFFPQLLETHENEQTCIFSLGFTNPSHILILLKTFGIVSLKIIHCIHSDWWVLFKRKCLFFRLWFLSWKSGDSYGSKAICIEESSSTCLFTGNFKTWFALLWLELWCRFIIVFQDILLNLWTKCSVLIKLAVAVVGFLTQNFL